MQVALCIRPHKTMTSCLKKKKKAWATVSTSGNSVKKTTFSIVFPHNPVVKSISLWGTKATYFIVHVLTPLFQN